MKKPLNKLERVPLRKGWKTEAKNTTLWLINLLVMKPCVN